MTNENIIESEQQRSKIEDHFTKKLEEYKTEAQKNAEKNISEIERNIQEQNNRLNNEALLQKHELDHLMTLKEKLDEENESYKRDLEMNAETVEDYAKK